MKKLTKVPTKAGLNWTGSREGDEAGGVCSVKKKE